MLAIAFLPTTNNAQAQSPSRLIKGSGAAVYFVGEDEKRYVFPNYSVFASWYASTTEVIHVTDAQLATYQLGGNVTYRPGYTLVKVTTDPRTYAVSRGGVLHWVMSEEIATQLYGADWNKHVVDVPDAFFLNYKIGEAIAEATMYNKGAEYAAAQVPSDSFASVILTAPTSTSVAGLILQPTITLVGPEIAGQVTVNITAASGTRVGNTLLMDGDLETGTVLALCKEAGCSATVQINTQGSLSAYTSVGGTYVRSNVIFVSP